MNNVVLSVIVTKVVMGEEIKWSWWAGGIAGFILRDKGVPRGGMLSCIGMRHWLGALRTPPVESILRSPF